MRGELTLGTMLGINSLAVGVLTPFSSLLSNASQFQKLGTYLDRLDDVLQAAPEQPVGSRRTAPRLSGRIEIEKISFRYGRYGRWAVCDVSVDIQAGGQVAIVGRSGAGKSTLAHLMVGLYRCDLGCVRYDGQDLWALDLQTVRTQLGVVGQHPVLFADSIRNNIALAKPDLPLSAVVRAAKLACLHDEIEEMPMGYDTVLIDRGASLSGGQRQRLALARALVHEPAIVLLDEATSALDSCTESLVQRSLAGLRCTRIVISHRLSTISGSDLILAMENGRVSEQGTHAQLLAKNGVYASLVASQLDLRSPRPLAMGAPRVG
jgi:ABC-type bacteriocin/lantibiotic exporter with double-glycine peptidase domain